jgi:hypothetical protein
VNVLKSHLRIIIETLLERGTSQCVIERRTAVSRKTIRRYAAAIAASAAAANSPGVATGSDDTDSPADQMPL